MKEDVHVLFGTAEVSGSRCSLCGRTPGEGDDSPSAILCVFIFATGVAEYGDPPKSFSYREKFSGRLCPSCLPIKKEIVLERARRGAEKSAPRLYSRYNKRGFELGEILPADTLRKLRELAE